MSKIVLEGFIEVSDDDLESVKRELTTHIELTKNEKGCIVFKVEQDPIYKNRFNVYEEFVDQAAFDAHQARVKTSKWGNATKNLKRNYTTKEVE